MKTVSYYLVIRSGELAAVTSALAISYHFISHTRQNLRTLLPGPCQELNKKLSHPIHHLTSCLCYTIFTTTSAAMISSSQVQRGAKAASFRICFCHNYLVHTIFPVTFKDFSGEAVIRSANIYLWYNPPL